MTRREEIEQAILENGIDYCENHPEMNMSLKVAFVMGAKWADKTMIEKACECLIKLHNWPTQYEEYARLQEEFIREFRKAMEE